jgi:hypothetical protein
MINCRLRKTAAAASSLPAQLFPLFLKRCGFFQRFFRIDCPLLAKLVQQSFRIDLVCGREAPFPDRSRFSELDFLFPVTDQSAVKDGGKADAFPIYFLFILIYSSPPNSN